MCRKAGAQSSANAFGNGWTRLTDADLLIKSHGRLIHPDGGNSQ